MTLSRKHFQRTANICKKMKLNKLIVNEFANWFKEENPLFDEDRFFNACYWGPYEEDD